MRLRPADPDVEPDATIRADAKSWERIATDIRGGMEAFRRGKLRVRRNLHLGVGFLAATSGVTEPGRLRFDAVETASGTISTLSAGTGPTVLCLHGLGGTKASFMPNVRGLADEYRVIAADLPGFGDSDKPITAAYDAPYFARTVIDLMDALEIERAHLIGNSMGGRVAIEVALIEPERVEKIVLLSPALAWLRDRPWKFLLPPQLPKLGLLQPAPRAITEPLIRRFVPGGEHGWAAAGVDEFLRAFLTPRGRAAFYSALRNIYVDEPHGEEGLWTRLAELSPDSMFVWGRQDTLVPISFMRARRAHACPPRATSSCSAATSPRSSAPGRRTRRSASSSRIRPSPAGSSASPRRRRSPRSASGRSRCSRRSGPSRAPRTPLPRAARGRRWRRRDHRRAPR